MPVRNRTPHAAPESFGVGRYRIVRLLGEGGQKTAYLARDTALARDVVISVLATAGLSETSVIRLRREARTMAQLGAHPNLVTVFDMGDDAGNEYVIAEYVDGGSVADLLRAGGERPLPTKRALSIARDVALALDYAHRAGVVHRDVKPANVWLTQDGTAKLGDFGLALASTFSDLTFEGALIGSALYMSPEQALGEKAKPASDIYALGAMLYEMVTGKPPFRADQMLGVLSQHIHTPPVAPSWHNSDLPKALENLILSMLQKKPDLRPPAGPVVADLRALISASETGEVAVQTDQTSLARLAEGVYVGRERVISRLRAAADEARAGRGGLFLLSGEPGSGKTRTTEQIALYAGIRGMRVLVGKCYEGEGAPAFWPWMQIIRAYAENLPPENLLSAMGSAAPSIARVVREVDEKLPGLAPPPPLDPDKERFRLFDGITSFLKNAAMCQPLVLILDDLHWADESSLLLLEFLAGELANSSVLAIATFRDLGPGRHNPLGRTLGELTRRAGERRFTLEGLTTTDIAKYVELSSGVAPADGLVAAIQQQTDGNPLFVAEVVRLLVAEGRFQEMEPGRSIVIPIPPSVREVIQRRLERLSAGCDGLLATGSVMGRGFALDVLCALHTECEDRILDLLDEAVAARLIEETGATPGHYMFSHALIRDAVYEQLGATRRARLHHRIGCAMESIYAGALQDYLPALAYHFAQAAQAGDREKAVRYSVLAAERATSLLAYEEAASHYEHALESHKRCGDTEEKRCELLLALGESLSRAGVLDRARTTLENAVVLARGLRRHDWMARAVLGIAPGVMGVLYGRADPVLRQLIEEALERTGKSDNVIRSRLLAHLSIAHYHTANEKRLALSREAVEMARRLGHPAALLPALYSHGIALMGFQKVEERLEVSTELVREAERAQNKEMLLRGYYGQFRELLGLGRRPQLDEAIEAYGRVASELRQPAYQWLYPFGRSVIALLEGRFEEAEELAREAESIGERARDRNAKLFLSTQLVNIRGAQGRSAEVLEPLRRYIEEYPFIPSWRASLARMCLDVGMREEARREMEAVAEDSEQNRVGA